MSAVTSSTGFSPDQVAFPPSEVIPDALIMTTATFAADIEGDAVAAIVPIVDADDDAAFTPEGAAITEAEPDTSTKMVSTGKVAVLGKVSREAYSQNNIPALISASFRRALMKKANTAYLAQAAPTGGAVTPPAGLVNQSLTAGGTVIDSLDAVVDAVAQVEDNYGAPSSMLVHPDSWAVLSKLKRQSGSNESLLGAGTADAARALLGIPVTVSPAVPSGALLVVDKTAIMAVYGQVLVATSEDAYFGSDAIGLRVTWRFGASIIDADRVVQVTVS